MSNGKGPDEWTALLDRRPSSRSGPQANWGWCISSLRPGSSAIRTAARTSITALTRWKASLSLRNSDTAHGLAKRRLLERFRSSARAISSTSSSTNLRIPGTACPAVWDGLAIVRLHGRNQETWNVKDAKAASDRFNYDNMEQRAAVDRDMHFLIVE